jgi:hypothetical protein
MKYRVLLTGTQVFVLLFALSAEPLRCGLPTVEISAAEMPPAVLITEAKTVQGFPYMIGGGSSEERGLHPTCTRNCPLLAVSPPSLTALHVKILSD